MPITKGTGTSVIASTTTGTTSAAFSATANYATELYISLVQIATPTTAASVQLQVSPDGGTTYYSPSTLLVTTPLIAGTYNYVLILPITATNYKAIFTAQTGGTSSTCVVQTNTVTAV